MMIILLLLFLQIPSDWKTINPDLFHVSRNGNEHTIYTTGSLDHSQFGGITRKTEAAPFTGQSIKFSVEMSANDITYEAGIYMVIRDKNGNKISPPGKNHLSISDCNPDWNTYEIVFYVPKEAESISYGVLLFGAGEITIRNEKLQITTDSPSNLNPQITNKDDF